MNVLGKCWNSVQHKVNEHLNQYHEMPPPEKQDTNSRVLAAVALGGIVGSYISPGPIAAASIAGLATFAYLTRGKNQQKSSSFPEKKKLLCPAQKTHLVGQGHFILLPSTSLFSPKGNPLFPEAPFFDKHLISPSTIFFDKQLIAPPSTTEQFWIGPSKREYSGSSAFFTPLDQENSVENSEQDNQQAGITSSEETGGPSREEKDNSHLTDSQEQALKAKIKELKRQNTLLKQKADSTEQTLIDTQDAWHQEKNSFVRAFQSWEDQRIKLNAMIEDQKIDIQNLEETFQALLQQKTTEVFKLKNQLQSEKNAYNELSDARSYLFHTLEALKENHKEVLKQNANLRKKLEDNESIYKQLLEDHEFLRQTHEKLKKTHQEKQKQHKELCEKSRLTEDAYEQLLKDHEHVYKTYEKFQKTHKKLIKDNQEKFTQITKQQEEIVDLQNGAELLLEKLRKAENKLITIRDKEAKIRLSELAKAKQTIDEQSSQLLKLQREANHFKKVCYHLLPFARPALDESEFKAIEAILD